VIVVVKRGTYGGELGEYRTFCLDIYY
jgi:hypothetical protein